MIDATTGEDIYQFDTRSGISNSAHWSKDGRHLLTAHDLNNAIIWEIDSGEAIKEFNHTAKVDYAAWNSDESQIATVDQEWNSHDLGC